MYQLRQINSTGYPVTFLMLSNMDHFTSVTGIIPIVNLSKNGSSFGAAGGSVEEISNGWYKLNGSSTDRNTLGELVIRCSGSGADVFETKYTIVPFDPFNGTSLGLSALPNAVAGESFGLPINDIILEATVNDASPTTTSFTGSAPLSSTDNFYQNMVLAFSSGTLRSIGRKITTYTGSTKLFTFASGYPVAPTNGDPFILLGLIE